VAGLLGIGVGIVYALDPGATPPGRIVGEPSPAAFIAGLHHDERSNVPSLGALGGGTGKPVPRLKCEDECVGETVRLTVVPDEGAAEALCGFLRSEGIDYFYRDTDVSAAGIFGGSTFGGWREILIVEDDLERARELLPDQPL
jgi:hypothetical protein